MSDRHMYTQGETIFRKGDPGEELFVVLSGRVGVTDVDGAGPGVVAEFPSGGVFGEMAVIDRQPRSATAVALEDNTSLMVLDAARFVYLVSQQPGFALFIMETLSSRQRGQKREAAEPVSQSNAPPEKAYDIIQVGNAIYQFRARGRSCNAYLLDGPKRCVLVDTGLPLWAPALHEALSSIGKTASDIDQIVCTHEHFDHIAAVPSFGGRPIVSASNLAANKIRLKDEFATMQRAFAQSVEPFAIDVELTPGSRIETGQHRLAVYATPGHTSGGISLFEEDSGIAIVGDTVLKGGAVGGVFGSGNTSDLVFSLDMLAGLRPRLLLPGHGPISDEPMSDIALTRARCTELLGGSQNVFEKLQADATINRVIGSFRDMNRQWLGLSG
ncbi:MAG: MBL fold metallo-hydrolase [Pseudomonadota bacterium]